MYFPPAQFEQVLALSTTLILPIKQYEHAANPAREYVPATHSLHGCALAGWPIPVLNVPAVHKLHPPDCAGEYVPAGQELHVAKGDEEYFPGAQARHEDGLLADGTSEKKPGGHLIHAVAIAPEYEPVVHGEQTAAPSADVYVPPWQSVQISGNCPPSVLDDFPAAHFKHIWDATNA